MQVKGNAEEFVMYGLLHAAVASPSQLAVDMRDVSGDLWPHPFMQHALQVRYAKPCRLLSKPRMLIACVLLSDVAGVSQLW